MDTSKHDATQTRPEMSSNVNIDQQPDDLIAAAIRALETCRETSFAASSDAIRINAILW